MPTSRPAQRRYDDPAQQAMVSLLYAAAHLMGELAVACEAHGLTHEQYNVLRILRGAGAEGLPRYEIAARMLYRAPDVTRLLDRLEARDLVRRTRAETDRRLSLTVVTRDGLALLDRMEPDIRAVHDAVAAPLTTDERRELARLCAQLGR